MQGKLWVMSKLDTENLLTNLTQGVAELRRYLIKI